jgi:hypothetical protein
LPDQTKKQRQEQARQARIEAQRRRRAAQRRKKIIGGTAIVLILGLTVGFIFATRSPKPDPTAAGCTKVQTFPELVSDPHIKETDPQPKWNSYPPTSGQHIGTTAPWGVSVETVDDRVLLHNLQHGGIVIHYKDLTTDEKDKIEALADDATDGLITNPNPKIDQRVVLTAWTHMQKCDKVNAATIGVMKAFIKARCNHGQEPFQLSC